MVSLWYVLVHNEGLEFTLHIDKNLKRQYIVTVRYFSN
jgi:hypothetical protein